MFPRKVLLACGEMQRQCLDLKLDAQRSIASAKAPHISYSKYADFLDEAGAEMETSISSSCSKADCMIACHRESLEIMRQLSNEMGGSHCPLTICQWTIDMTDPKGKPTAAAKQIHTSNSALIQNQWHC